MTRENRKRKNQSPIMATFSIHVVQFAVFVFLAVVIAEGRKTQDMIYVNIKSFQPCIRRLNATHQIGCTSAIKGNNGVVHYINNTQSLQWLIKTGPHEPYIPLITADMFTAENLKALMNSGKISGVMVIHTEDSDPPSSGFSPEHTCPNDNFGLYTENKHPDYSHCKKTEWNPLGSGLSFEDYDFPIFVMTNQSEVNNLIECYKDRNEPVQEMARRYPLCAVQMTDRMDGAKDTVTCMRRSSITNNLEAFVYCDPLGDYNVFGYLQPTNKSKPLESDSVIVAAAKLDSNSMFYSVQPVPGAENDATGYVTLLSAIETLGRLPEDTKQAMKNIMFTFLNGESWDYIGSSRMVYDMERGEFPSKLDSGKEQPAMMNLSHISHFVELRQLGLMNASQLWVHGDPVSQKIPSVKSKVGHMMGVLSTAGGHFGLDVQRASDDQPLPPASFQRFLRKANISGVVITDHGKEFANRFYQSRFDLPKMIQADYSNATEDYISPLAEQLNNVSSALAQTLYKLAHPNGSDVLNANINITNQMLYCFLYKPDCTLFRTVTAKDYKLSKTPIPKYVGVFKESTRSQHTTIVEHLMAYFLGKELDDVAEDDCKNQDNDKIYKYEVIGGVNGNGTCLRSFSYYTPAESPAFLNDDWDSTEYSTWTESRWSKTAFSARAFYIASTAQQTVLLSTGVIILLLSLVIVYFINKRSDILFSQDGDPY